MSFNGRSDHRRTYHPAWHQLICNIKRKLGRSCDLDLDLDLDIGTWPEDSEDVSAYRNELTRWRLPKVRTSQTDRQTDRRTDRRTDICNRKHDHAEFADDQYEASDWCSMQSIAIAIELNRWWWWWWCITMPLTRSDCWQCVPNKCFYLLFESRQIRMLSRDCDKISCPSLHYL